MKKWLDKKANPDVLEVLCLIAIIIFVFLLINDLILFGKATHNIDLVFNFESVSNSLCRNYNILVNLTDQNNNFGVMALKEYYIIGMNQVNKSFISGLTNIAAIFVIIGILIGIKLVRKK